MVVGVLLFIDLGIMTTWQVADPFYRETKQMEPYVSAFISIEHDYKKKNAKRMNQVAHSLLSFQPHPSSEDIIIIPENEYCQSNRMTIYLGCIYAYKGLLMVGNVDRFERQRRHQYTKLFQATRVKNS